MKNIMGLILDVVESGTDAPAIGEGVNPDKGSSLGTELKNILDSSTGFITEHSKGFAIAISCFCALVVIAIVFWLFKKILCKKGRKYYRYRR